jgi:hypothetical protein
VIVVAVNQRFPLDLYAEQPLQDVVDRAEHSETPHRLNNRGLPRLPNQGALAFAHARQLLNDAV